MHLLQVLILVLFCTVSSLNYLFFNVNKIIHAALKKEAKISRIFREIKLVPRRNFSFNKRFSYSRHHSTLTVHPYPLIN